MRAPVLLVGWMALGVQFVLPGHGDAAAKFVVTSTADAPDVKPGDGVCAASSKQCTLRAALEEANAAPGRVIVELRPGRYEVDAPLKSATPVVLSGAQPRDTIVAASAAFTGERVLTFDDAGQAGWREVANLTVDGNGRAGGLTNRKGVALRLLRVVVRRGVAREGGAAIAASGPLVLLQSSLVDNRLQRGGGRGGALLVEDAPAWITQTTVTGNFGRNSGGIFARNAAVALHYSSLVGNTGGPVGGYQQNPRSTLELRGSWLGESIAAGGSRRIDCRSSAQDEAAVASGGDNLLAVTGPTSDKLVNGAWQPSYEFFCSLNGANDRLGAAQAPLEGEWNVVTGPTGLVGVAAAASHPASRMVRPDHCPAQDAWGRAIPPGQNCDAGALYAGDWTAPAGPRPAPVPPPASPSPAPRESAKASPAPDWLWGVGFGIAAGIAALLIRRRRASSEKQP